MPCTFQRKDLIVRSNLDSLNEGINHYFNRVTQSANQKLVENSGLGTFFNKVSCFHTQSNIPRIQYYFQNGYSGDVLMMNCLKSICVGLTFLLTFQHL